MKVYVAAKKGVPVKSEYDIFNVAEMNKTVKDLISSDEKLSGCQVIKIDLAKLEKGGTLPKEAIKCFAVVCDGDKFVLGDGVIIVAKTKDVAENSAASNGTETVVRAVLY